MRLYLLERSIGIDSTIRCQLLSNRFCLRLIASRCVVFRIATHAYLNISGAGHIRYKRYPCGEPTYFQQPVCGTACGLVAASQVKVKIRRQGMEVKMVSICIRLILFNVYVCFSRVRVDIVVHFIT